VLRRGNSCLKYEGREHWCCCKVYKDTKYEFELYKEGDIWVYSINQQKFRPKNIREMVEITQEVNPWLTTQEQLV
jgi:hypothetical protein